MSKRIYVACASAEMDRAKWALSEVRKLGFEVTADWAALVEKVGVANPTEDAVRRQASLFDLDGVERAEVFWLLFPQEKDRGYGTGPELGYALAPRKFTRAPGGRSSPLIVTSGVQTKRSIFPVLSDYEVATDEEALTILRSLTVSKKTVERGFYQHHKGGIYFVHGIAENHDGGPPLVIYESLQGVNKSPQRMCYRTLDEFIEEVPTVRGGEPTSDPRFVRISKRYTSEDFPSGPLRDELWIYGQSYAGLEEFLSTDEGQAAARKVLRKVFGDR